MEFKMRVSIITLSALWLFMPPTSSTTTFPDCVNGPQILITNLVCNTTASPADRAAAIVSAFNISEKLVNLVNTSPGAPRIGLAAYEWWSEALHGLGYSPGVNFSLRGDYSYATSFPNPITMSAAFDDDMIESVATIISTEARAFSNAGRAGLDFWTPNVNPYKDPRWGRGAETPGEDPFRIKGYTKSLLLGLEGDQSFKKVIATCKHFAAYDLEKWNGAVRYGFDAVVGMQDLVEYYLPPFQQCARDSKVGSIMCSYNAVNGTPACANTYLMQTILREHWGWTEDNQYITSDCNAVQGFYANHNFTATAAQAAGKAYTAGCDTICQVGHSIDVTSAHNQSLLSEATVDQALSRMYQMLIRAGYFDPAEATPYRSYGWGYINTPHAQLLALQAAADGILLKKNNGVLPLSMTAKPSLALIGFWANATTQMLGGYSGRPPYINSPIYAAQQLGYQTFYATGPLAQTSSDNDTWTSAALAAAKQADIIVYYGGTDNSIAAEELDRYNITWPSAQLSLLTELSALGKPLIVAELGDQVDDTALLANHNISAILWAGYPGQDGGTAVLNILTGTTAPAGRLPVTVYPGKYVNQVPMTDMSLRPSATNPGRTYMWYNESVLPFGYGLHYTTFNASFAASTHSYDQKKFSIQDLMSACNETKPDLCSFTSLPLSVSVQNTGNVTSDFVVLAFLSGSHGPLPYPIKRLTAYTRLRGITAGNTGTAELVMTLGSLARVDVIGNLVLYSGTYKVLLDVDGVDSVSFELVGTQVVLDLWPQPNV
ncbi:glycoside hydrolase family 3 protein [Mollisia scopiformis]|uniref:xylan 1,4-beta-xylosidase n=1 Tax=Mollisia scopiformis TaxID=149040 RepID=A0A194X439_MOLSC|nr:glycoside hydrolase family 3 protein [Mollisia scopiformis]KUJ14582.1 glycoside hydrolase family 3 protein [Mollisia scopiformis]